MIKNKTTKFAVPGFARAATTIYNPKNFKKTKMTGVIYGKGDQKIKQTKVIVKEYPRKTVTKTINFSPVNYYGKQKKTISKVINRKK